MWGINDQAFKHSTANTSTIDPRESLYDLFVEKVREAFPTDSERQRKIILQMSEIWLAFVGSPVERQSLKFFFGWRSVSMELCFPLIPTALSRRIPRRQAGQSIHLFVLSYVWAHLGH